MLKNYLSHRIFCVIYVLYFRPLFSLQYQIISGKRLVGNVCAMSALALAFTSLHFVLWMVKLVSRHDIQSNNLFPFFILRYNSFSCLFTFPSSEIHTRVREKYFVLMRTEIGVAVNLVPNDCVPSFVVDTQCVTHTFIWWCQSVNFELWCWYHLNGENIKWSLCACV